MLAVNKFFIFGPYFFTNSIYHPLDLWGLHKFTNMRLVKYEKNIYIYDP
jgi:hypothetical protein